MNNQYFACRDCKTCIDAGYRWAWWALVEAGIVVPSQEISVTEVLNYDKYWNGAKETPWLAESLPYVNKFLNQHKTHNVTYGIDENFQDTNNEFSCLDWVYEEKPEDAIHASPPYFLYRLNLLAWADVVEAVESSQVAAPWWWELSDFRLEARRRFDQLKLEKSAVNVDDKTLL